MLVWAVVAPFSAAAADAVPLTAEERAWLDRNPDKLTLYFNTDFPPIEFISPTGVFTGMGADIFAMVEQRLGVVFSKRPMRDWNRHLAALESGECAIAPTIVRTAERERFAFFTIPYATVPVVIIAGRSVSGQLSLDDLAGRRVGVVSGFATETYLRDRSFGAFEIVTVQTVAEGLRGVSFGQFDVFVENLAVAAYYIAEEGIPNLRVAGKTDYVFAWSIGVSRKYPLMFSAIAKALAAVPEADIDAVRKRWIALDMNLGMSPETVRLFKMSGMFLLLLVAGLVVITFFLKRSLDEKVAAIRENESIFTEFLKHSPVYVFFKDKNIRSIRLSRNFERMLGMPLDRILGKTMDEIFPSDLSKKMIQDDMRILNEGVRVEVEEEFNGRTYETIKFPIFQNGEPFMLAGFTIDITERKQAEAEKADLEAQLRQAQKMESVGRLAGGVAHDFNNMLGVIIGYAEMVMHDLGENHPSHYRLAQIRNAAERSAKLTRQLLAFARKQTITPRVLDLNETVGSMLNMLRRLIGEDIALSWLPGENLWPVKMDPAQIDQILANLCVNARDAIAGVGKVIIETKNTVLCKERRNRPAAFPSGAFVRLTVTDTGCGMSRETKANIFEPFFTTKEMGKGTGLGLAMVYGIVKQNNGFIDVRSAPGQGTTFSIYLPRHDGAVESSPPEMPETAAEKTQSGRETILLVEDEPAILEMTAAMLETGGYTVLSAATPAQAILVAEAHAGVIQLLITDVIMPEMNGPDLAERLFSIHPGLECLFMSGYMTDTTAFHGVLDEDVAFIQKPFSTRDLLAAVRKVLGTDNA